MLYKLYSILLCVRLLKVMDHYLNVSKEQVNKYFSFKYFYFFISGVPPNNYISFYGMRGHDILMGHLVSKKFH